MEGYLTPTMNYGHPREPYDGQMMVSALGSMRDALVSELDLVTSRLRHEL